jgi:hypothetical protein
MAQRISQSRRGGYSSKEFDDRNDDSFPSVDEIPRLPLGYAGTSVRQKIAFFEQANNPPREKERMTIEATTAHFDGEEDPYDLTSVHKLSPATPQHHAFSIDPFEHEEIPLSPNPQDYSTTDEGNIVDEDDYIEEQSREQQHHLERHCMFLVPNDIHPNMEHKEDDIQRLRLLAGKLSVEWGHADFMAPALARRLRDFQFAQEKRRKKYGDERPWGILGVYDHLASIRIDAEWAEDAARRRANGDSYQSWADYDEGKKGKSNRPYFTYILLFICTTAMISSIAVNDWSIEPIDENPMVGPSAETLILMGAKESKLIVIQKEGWRLLTSAILHVSGEHVPVQTTNQSRNELTWSCGWKLGTGWICSFLHKHAGALVRRSCR